MEELSLYCQLTKVEELKRHLRPGRVYRREDLAQWSKAVDRHLKWLVSDGTLTKLAPGLYLPRASLLPVSRPGHFSFHSRSTATSFEGSGTVRSPACDFGLPITW